MTAQDRVGEGWIMMVKESVFLSESPVKTHPEGEGADGGDSCPKC